MPRQARFVVPEVALHIVQRGHNRRDCFLEEADYLTYLSNLRDLLSRTGCALHAYCLMTNHAHMLVTPSSAQACALLMRNQGQRYVQYFNRRYGRSGTLWEGRYKSSLIQSPTYLLRTYRYIERNPVRADMVAAPADYPWSSHAGNCGRVENRLLAPRAEYLALGIDEPSRFAAYEAFVAIPDEPGFLATIRDATNGGFALASESFKSELPPDRQQRLARRRPGPPPKAPSPETVDLFAELGLRPRTG
jgi:putative transposase